MLTRSTAAASVSVAVLPETATGLVSARSTAVPPTFTVNALSSGTAAMSRAPSKVIVSAAPFTDADENAGGVTLVTACLVSAGAELPDRSLIRFAAFGDGTYHTCTVCPCEAAWLAANVTVAELPESETPVAAGVSPGPSRPSRPLKNPAPDSDADVSSASFHVMVIFDPFIVAETNAGAVVSRGARLATERRVKVATVFPARSRSVELDA